MNAADIMLAAELRAELAEADQIAVWRTRQALEEFENAWREWSAGRGYVVPLTELRRRRAYTALPPDHPLARRDPWPPELLGRAANGDT